MSNPESFIEEVSDEVRKDRLFAVMRRYGWIGVLAVLFIVGAAVVTEWQRAQQEALAERFGDQLLEVLQAEDAQDGTAIETQTPGQESLKRLFEAALATEAGESQTASEQLNALATNSETEALYRDLALLKVQINGGTGDTSEDQSILETLAAPGQPFRALALEQLALRSLKNNDRDEALLFLKDILEAPETSDLLRRRALQLIVSLGGNPNPA